MRLLLAAALVVASSCAGDVPPCDPLLKPGDYACGLKTWAQRGYLIHLPPSFDTASSFPVVIVMHGGASDAVKMRSLTCGKDGCLDDLADEQGFVVVYPNGTPTAGLDGVRAWNAGGGAQGFRCVNGPACRDQVDDVSFTRTLLDDVSRVIRVERTRVYAAGFSNGAAMAHRLACELSDKLAAIAAVSGANQVAEVQGCEPRRAVPVLQIHGDGDTCWPFAGGPGACFEEEGEAYVGVDLSMTKWIANNGCAMSAPTSEMLDDVDPSDGTRVQKFAWPFCMAPVEMLEISGGGHAWPGGPQYRAASEIGPVSKDIDANAVIWSFFAPLSAP